MITISAFVMAASTLVSSVPETPANVPPSALPKVPLSASGAFLQRPHEAPESRFRLELEGGALWTSRNDVRIPGTTGTQFSLMDLTGTGPWPVGRVTVEYDINERHGLRLLYAPIRTDGTGTLSQETTFAGTTFDAGLASARYRFDTYRLGYRYRFWDSDDWSWKGGVTALIRDASIQVSQGAQSAEDTDLGVVPLFNLTGVRRLSEEWSAILDIEGAAAPAGRAVDAALKLSYRFDDRTEVAIGYRTIEGGADNDSVYTFAWTHAAVVSIGWRL